MITFVVPGNPQALKRHRNAGKFNYDPSKGDKQDFLVKCLQHKPIKPFNTPLALELTFRFNRPKNHYRTGKYSHLLKDSAPQWHTGTPDTDNLIKFVCDSLNGIFWRDDSIICKVKARKFYSETPNVEIVIDFL